MRPWLGLAVLWLLWPWGLGPVALARDYPLEIIELRSRLPEELIPVLAPLAGPDGSVVGARHALFVRAAPERLADIRRALAELDRPARSLLIQVRQGSSLDTSRQGVGVWSRESWGSGEPRGRVRVGPPGPEGAGIIASAGRDNARRDLIQEVRALDGHPAFIAIGRDQPLAFQELEIGRDGTRMRRGHDYWRAETGFSVVPRVLGERVILEIEARSASPGGGGAIDTGVVAGRVEGRLGDWIPVGASSESGQGQSAGLLYGAQGRREAQGQVELRVVPLD
ncbi:MAG: hypothetical protein ACM3ST_16600 [Bdellovibrio bacteriovorus]